MGDHGWGPHRGARVGNPRKKTQNITKTHEYFVIFCVFWLIFEYHKFLNPTPGGWKTITHRHGWGEKYFEVSMGRVETSFFTPPLILRHLFGDLLGISVRLKMNLDQPGREFEDATSRHCSSSRLCVASRPAAARGSEPRRQASCPAGWIAATGSCPKIEMKLTNDCG